MSDDSSRIINRHRLIFKTRSPIHLITRRESMNREKMIKELEVLYKSKLELIKKKNTDYARKNDCFSNFEISAIVSGMSVERVFLSIIGIKLARALELIMNCGIAENESLEDTLIDLGNYVDLLLLWIKNGNEIFKEE